METVIDVEGLTKVFKIKNGRRFEEKAAVNNLSFEVKKSEIVAFIGPNGGGKSTVIKMLTSILFPSSGNARVLGLIPWRERGNLVRKIGVVFGQKSQLYYHLRPYDTYRLLGAAYTLSDKTTANRIKELASAFEIESCLYLPVKNLSLGQRMRCELIASLLHRPSVLFLDEPTLGLDIEAKYLFRSFLLKQVQKEGTTVFLTSHDINDIEHLCQRILLINHGTLLLDSDMQHLKKQYEIQRVLCVKKTTGEIEKIPFSSKNSKHVLTQLNCQDNIADFFVCPTDLETIITQILRT